MGFCKVHALQSQRPRSPLGPPSNVHLPQGGANTRGWFCPRSKSGCAESHATCFFAPGLFDSPSRSRFSHVVAGTCSRLLRTVFHYLPHTFDGHDSPTRYAGWGPFLPPDGEGSPESGRGSGLRGHSGRQRWARGPPRALLWIPTPQTPQHCTEPPPPS